MGIEALAGYDFAAGEQPVDTTDRRAFLEAWYRYQRHEFIRKLRAGRSGDSTDRRVASPG